MRCPNPFLTHGGFDWHRIAHNCIMGLNGARTDSAEQMTERTELSLQQATYYVQTSAGRCSAHTCSPLFCIPLKVHPMTAGPTVPSSIQWPQPSAQAIEILQGGGQGVTSQLQAHYAIEHGLQARRTRACQQTRATTEPHCGRPSTVRN